MLHDDVRTLRGADLPRIDVIVGSPPCQDLSAANPRAAGIDGARSGLFFEAIRLVGECRPAWGCFENVPAARTRGIDRAIEALEALDYACWPLVVGADSAGAPHRRDRLWLVFADPSRSARQQIARGASGDEGEDEGGQAEHDHGSGGLVARSNDAADADGRGRKWPGRRRPWQAAWQAGLPDLAQLDDGPAAELARNGALYRAICAAQGDAIVPQVAYHIVRAMSALFPDARRVLDLFCGAVGGWTYACTWAGLEVVAACEIDPWRREVYAAVHHGSAA